MTAFAVLQSIFGNSLAPGELDDALDRMDGTLRVQCNTWLIVSSSNSADKSSEETGCYLHLHHKASIFPVATMALMQLDLGVEAPRQGTMDIK